MTTNKMQKALRVGTVALCRLFATIFSPLVLADPLLAESLVDETRHNSAMQKETEAIAVEEVVSHLEGTMSTAAQAASDPNFVGVQMTTCRITLSDPQPQSVYLYQEQALADNLNAPYRQRFLQITPGDDNRINSLTFKPQNPEQWTGLCAQPNPSLNSAVLGDPFCTVSLRASSLGGYVGSTPTGGCPASARGAVSVTNVVVLHAAGMDTWDRGFDAQGNQVWGADDVPYRYRR